MIANLNLLKLDPTIQIASIRMGLDASTVEKLVVDYQFHLPKLATMLGLTPHALTYRVRRGLRLDSLASERLLRLARVADHASCIFGDSISAGNWLMRPHSALNQSTPFSMLDTAYGAQEIERILCSIEYGLPV